MNNFLQIQDWLETVGFEFLVIGIVTSTIVMGAAWALDKFLSRASADVRSLVWQSAFAMALLLPLALMILPEIPLGYRVPFGYTGWDQPQATVAHVDGHEVSPGLDLPPQFQAVDGFVRLHGNSPLAQSDAVVAAPSIGSASHPATSENRNAQFFPIIHWRSVIVAIWMLVSTILLIRIVACYLISFTWLRNSKRFAIRNNGQSVRISSGVHVPVTIGIVRPRILLPESARDWSAVRLQMVVEHETAHVRRHDVFWNMLAMIAKSVFWIQPLMWVTYQRLAVTREQACDDQVINRGTDANDYASELIAIAGELFGKRLPSSIGVGVTQPPLESRIRSILNETALRSTLSRRTKCVSFSLLLVCMLIISIVRPFEDLASANSVPHEPAMYEASVAHTETEPALDDSNDRNAESDELPERVTGTITNALGEPIANAKLHVVMSGPFEFAIYHFQKLHEWHVESDSAGKFSVEIPDELRSQNDFRFGAMITAEGYVRKTDSFNNKNIRKRGSFGTSKLQLGRLITGRVVKPENIAYGPTKKPTVRFYGISSADLDHRPWFGMTVNCSPDGKFRTYVPRSGKVSFVASAENYAPVRGEFEAPEDLAADQEVGEIPLQKGSSVFGNLVDEHDRPIKGVVVQIHENELNRVGDIDQVISSVASSVKTDANGYFHLPPHTGPCTVFVSTHGFSRGSGYYGSLISDQKPPVVNPIVIDLAKPGISTHLKLRPAKTFAIRGVVRWDDDTPTANIIVTGTVMAGNVGRDVSMTRTDDAGRYELHMPIESEYPLVRIFGSRRNGNWYCAYPTETYEAYQKTSQSLCLQNNQQDFEGADWVLKDDSKPTRPIDPRDKPAPLNAPISKIYPASTASGERLFMPPADRELVEISNDYYSRQSKIAALYRNMSTQKQKREVSEKQSQHRLETFDRLFDLEARFRGEVAAVNALGAIVELSCNITEETNDSDNDKAKPKAKRSATGKAYDKAVELLQQHYVNHADVWLCLSEFERAFPFTQFPTALMQQIQTKNPYPINRAHALYSHSNFLSQLLSLSLVDGLSVGLTNEHAEFLKGLDRNEMISTINANVARIENELAGVKMLTTGLPENIQRRVKTTHGALHSFVSRRVKSSSFSYQDFPFTELARNIKFKANQLQIGAKFPTDFWNDDVEDAVAGLTGSNVLLLVTFTNPGPAWSKLFQQIRKLPDLRIVWLRHNNFSLPLGAAGQALLDPESTGVTLLHDSPTESLVRRWSFMDTEAFYLIDEKGMLRSVGINLNGVLEAIEELVE